MKDWQTVSTGPMGAMLALVAMILLLLIAAPGCGAPSATTPTEETGGPSAVGTNTSGASGAVAAPTAAGQVPDWTQHGFAVIGGQDIEPGAHIQLTAGGLIFDVPRNCFTMPVRFDVLAADPGTIVSMPPAGMTPLTAFALRVTDRTNGRLVGQFNTPVRLTALNAGITLNSMYYTLSADGNLIAMPAGMIARPGELDDSIAAATHAGLIMSPSVSTGAG